jgi:4-diphosphocytidyl-2-C-methyl-D-erythritol kinase
LKGDRGAKMNRKILKKRVNLRFVENLAPPLMICFPNAKINIGLNVTSKRSDGYHNIETLFYPIGLADILEIVARPEVPAGTIEFGMSGIMVAGSPESNLVVKAHRLISLKHSLPGVSVHLHKRIPSGAGLGGGSSDGAFMLRALDEFFDLRIPTDQLGRMALELGSDCPFFLNPVPSVATGRGEILEPVDFKLRGLWLYLFQPVGGISTAEAYKAVKVEEPEKRLSEMICLPPESWKGKIDNAFQDHAVKQILAIGEILAFLENKEAIYSSLTGSGSAVYGFFNKEIDIPSSLASFLVWKEMLS